MPRVWNKRDPKTPRAAQYVGRGQGSILGNPFTHLTKDTMATHIVATLHDAIHGFELYARARAAKEPAFRALIKSMYLKDLVCWCAPQGGIQIDDERLLCHAQIIGRLAKEFHEADVKQTE